MRETEDRQLWIVGVTRRTDEWADQPPGADDARFVLEHAGFRFVGPAEEGDGFWVVSIPRDRDVFPGMDENGPGQTCLLWDRPFGGEADRTCGVCGGRRRLRCECEQWLCGPCLPSLPICFVCERNHTDN